jgi:hypothetical protein
MSPDLKSVDNQDISNHRPRPSILKNINHFTIFSMVPFLLIYMEINLKRMDVTKDFVLGLYQSPVLLNGHFLVPLTNLKLYPEELHPVHHHCPVSWK